MAQKGTSGPTPAKNGTGKDYMTQSGPEKESKMKKQNEIQGPPHQLPLSSGGISVYVIVVVGVVPAAGAFLWCLRYIVCVSPKIDSIDAPCSCPQSPNQGIVGAEEIIVSIQKSTESLDQFSNSATDTKWKSKCLEYPRQNLDLLEILGEGNFGVVWKAEAVNICESRHTTIVAVKTVKENALYKERQELLKELSVMQKFDYHPNVVKLLGCCTKTEPYLLIMEFVKKGKLQSYLREHRSKRKYYDSNYGLKSRDLTMFAYQVALGMEYISSVAIIHRDLAARNILVDHNNNCKVADFGLSRYFKDRDNCVYEQKTKGALPIRWMAPESLCMSIFTTKSDVWAFGILLWEIVTLGSTPYPGMSAREVIYHVQKENIMECPEHCHPELYFVMRACWMANPDNRPTFTVLCKKLEELLHFQTGYVDLDHFPENSYYNLYQSPGEKV